MDKTAKISADTRVTILMGVHNGAMHLPEQLRSIAAQTHADWHLIASDDRSCDDSRKILDEFARRHPGRVSVRNGPAQGFSANYMCLIRRITPHDGYICFADQDDIWMPEKLARGLALLAANGTHPALACGRRWVWQAARGYKQASATLKRPFSLRNALIENIASGNTIMLNPAAARIAQMAARRTGPVFAHDWWLYLLMAGSGGSVIFDNRTPALLYRQHAGNVIGAGRTPGQQIRRKIGVLKGEFANRVDTNLKALSAVADMLTPDAQKLLQDFAKARSHRGIRRLTALRAVALYRQKWMHTLGFWGAASLGRI